MLMRYEKYKLSCNAYLAEYIKSETLDKHSLSGWYHYISNPDFNTVGVVATAQVLILIKKCMLNVEFDCKPMIESLLYMQNIDGGWKYRSNLLESATEPTARSVQALILWDDFLNSEQRQAVQKGIKWLLRNKNEAYLWGPINKEEKCSFTYFSCVALQSLQEVVQVKREYISIDIINDIKDTIRKAIDSLLAKFNDSDIQCGWGITDLKNPTLFHTAYIVYTILTIDFDCIKKHALIKSLNFLKEYFINSEQCHTPSNQYYLGENEIYQQEERRLVYTHSVDIYIVMALLQDSCNDYLNLLKDKCEYFIDCAEKTDWRYREYITCWRLFDIVSLCDYYDVKLGRGIKERMEHYKIAFTFAGESRDLVYSIVEEISKEISKSELFYDNYHKEKLARANLDTYLQNLYHNCSDLIVVFLGEDYAKKKWCGVEWRSIKAILNNFKDDKIMYIKATKKDLDDIGLPGFYSSVDGYIDASLHNPEEIAQMIIKRYESIQKTL